MPPIDSANTARRNAGAIGIGIAIAIGIESRPGARARR